VPSSGARRATRLVDGVFGDAERVLGLDVFGIYAERALEREDGVGESF
jgi:hypothetical protein